MRKNVFGRRLKRDKNERRALFKSLMSSLVLKERIKTTEAKGKAIKGRVDKLITMAKKDKVRAQRLLASYLTLPALKKLTLEIAPRFTNRIGGYTRIIRLPQRLSDNAAMVLMEWVEGEQKEEGNEVSVSQPVSAKKGVNTKTKTKTKRAAKTKPTTKPKNKKRETK